MPLWTGLERRHKAHRASRVDYFRLDAPLARSSRAATAAGRCGKDG